MSGVIPFKSRGVSKIGAGSLTGLLTLNIGDGTAPLAVLHCQAQSGSNIQVDIAISKDAPMRVSRLGVGVFPMTILALVDTGCHASDKAPGTPLAALIKRNATQGISGTLLFGGVTYNVVVEDITMQNMSEDKINRIQTVSINMKARVAG